MNCNGNPQSTGLGTPRSRNKDCTTVVAAPVLPVGYVAIARRIADRRMILAVYHLADLLTRIEGKLKFAQNLLSLSVIFFFVY
jgi:hypothetical protein